jgi:hypothetical protein
LQPRLLLRRKPAELCIVFEFAALLFGRQVSIATEPVSGVAGLILRRARFGTSFASTGLVGMRFFLKLALLLTVLLLT